MSTEGVISINKLSKQYSSSQRFAIKDLTISVGQGEVYGFLGPNGAGKSTTIRTLLNFIQPTGGGATIQGQDIVQDSLMIRRKVGYLAGNFSAYDKMTGRQFLKYMQDLQPLKQKKYLSELIKRFNVNTTKKIGELSKGNKQKLGIVQAVMHQPEVLILDEPTDGLDPLMQEEFYSLLRQQKQQGVTIFFSSHNLAEVRKICDRIGIIKDGRLVTEQTLAEMAEHAAQTFTITFVDKAPVGALKALSGVSKLQTPAPNQVSLHVKNSGLPGLLKFLSNQKLAHLQTQELNLEDEFMKYYEKGGK